MLSEEGAESVSTYIRRLYGKYKHKQLPEAKINPHPHCKAAEKTEIKNHEKIKTHFFHVGCFEEVAGKKYMW